ARACTGARASCRTSRPTGARAARRARRAAVDDAHGEVLVADVDDADLAVDAGKAVDLLHFLVGDVGGRGRLLLCDRDRRGERERDTQRLQNPRVHLASSKSAACRATIARWT